MVVASNLILTIPLVIYLAINKLLMPSFLKDKEIRIFISSLLLLLIGVGLIALLMFVDLPEGNKALINILIGAYAGALGLAINRFIGDDNEEIRKLRERIQEVTQDCESHSRSLIEENIALKARISELAERLDNLQSKILDKNL
jgi:helix-turn-helix protein